MADKEGFIAKAKMLTYAIFNTQHANFIIHSMRFTNRTFIGFFSGKILDSAIIGVLCYIGMNFLNMPYILLISVIICITNVIPFFGPYLGAIPSIFLILLVDPLQADMDKPAKCRVKHCKNRNANDHTWDSKDSTANKDGDNDQKTGKSCGITKNLRSKNIAVKLLENKNKNCKINSLQRIHQ